MLTTLLLQTVAFANVTVLPMDREGVLADQTVVVRDGRIAEVGPAARVRVPAGALRVDGRGRYLMPGLAEMHGHLPNPNAGAAITETVLFLYVANGVTVVRGMQGNTDHLDLKRRVAAGEVLGPRLFVPGPQLSGNSVPTADSGRRLVEAQQAAGFDHVKIQEGLARDVYDTIVATAKRVGIAFAGHVPNAVGVPHALASGQKSIDHLDNYVETVGGPDSADDARIGQVVAATCAAGTWTVPTLALWEVFLGTDDPAVLGTRPELQYVPPQWRANWAQQVGQMRQNAAPGGGAPPPSPCGAASSRPCRTRAARSPSAPTRPSCSACRGSPFTGRWLRWRQPVSPRSRSSPPVPGTWPVTTARNGSSAP